jgi:hypothetical protein
MRFMVGVYLGSQHCDESGRDPLWAGRAWRWAGRLECLVCVRRDERT